MYIKKNTHDHLPIHTLISTLTRIGLYKNTLILTFTQVYERLFNYLHIYMHNYIHILMYIHEQILKPHTFTPI